MDSLIRTDRLGRERGDSAFEIIDRNRKYFNDLTRIERLSAEFPYLAATHPEASEVGLVNLSDNSVGAFKWRGAVVAMKALKEHGVGEVTAPSAGNHARGAALAAKLFDMYIQVVVPKNAPPPKRDKIRDLWHSHKLSIKVIGETFDESLAWAIEQNKTILHPYDNPDVITGQGTVVDDVLALNPEVDQIFVPVGGAGLVSGVLQRLYELGRSDISVFAAQAEGSNSLSNSLMRGKLTEADNPNQLFGGSAVRMIGGQTFEICKNAKNLTVVSVPNDDVAWLSCMYDDSRRELLRSDTPNFEPTSLVAIAALLRATDLSRRTVVLGTGQNELIHPLVASRSYRLPF